jgi:hypothetical protein
MRAAVSSRTGESSVAEPSSMDTAPTGGNREAEEDVLKVDTAWHVSEQQLLRR